MQLWIAILLLVFSTSTYGQSKKFVSDVDQSLTLNTLNLLPLVDNVGGIYAKPGTTTVLETLESLHRWQVAPVPLELAQRPEYFEAAPGNVQALLRKLNSQGLLAGRIVKGPKGLNLAVTLYVGLEGFPLGSETLSDYDAFEIGDVQNQLKILTQKLMQKMPYHTTILSRKGRLLTVGLGRSSGVRAGTEMTVMQIVNVTRHPKFRFILATENLTLGKIRIEKVEEELSFASLLSERTAGAVVPGTKVSWDQFVQYPAIATTSDGKLITDPALTKGLAFNSGGEASTAGAKEWVTSSPPAFGKAGLSFGLGSASISNGLSSGGVSGSSSIVPSVHANGEMWLTPNWFLNAKLDTWIYSVNNGLSGSTPGTLNVSQTQTALSGGYNFLLDNDFNGAKIKVSGGYSVASTFVDGSAPTAFESTRFSGLNFGLGFEFPLAPSMSGGGAPVVLGGRLIYFLTPSVAESPTTSGAGSSAQMASFAGYGSKRISERMNLIGEFAFDSWNANFTGQGTRATSASSSSQSMITLSFGAEYLF